MTPLEALKYHQDRTSARPRITHQPSVWERGAVQSMDPSAGPSSWYFPQDRLQQLENQYQTAPGRRPGGSGLTGLTSGDAQGWSRMLEEQQEFMNLNAVASRKARPGMQTAPMQERHYGSGIAPATGEANDPWSLGGQTMPQDSRRRKNTAAAVAGLKGIR